MQIARQTSLLIAYCLLAGEKSENSEKSSLTEDSEVCYILLELKYFTGTNTFEHAEFKSEMFPLRRHAVFAQTAILSSLISPQIFSLLNDTDG